MAEQNFDAIVIGSGISGGWAAKELTEKGLKVLMLERGRNIEHVKDYVNANKEAWDYPHHGRKTQEMIAQNQVLDRDYPLNEQTYGMWVKDTESPYVEVKRYDWFRGYHVGGRSLLWGRQSYRWSDLDFEANAKDGIAVDWPVRYKEIEPWYDYVEKFAGISGNRDGLDVLPDGQFMPPMEMTCVEKDVAKRLKEYYKGQRAMIIGRTANITQELEGRSACQFRNKCWLGCPFGAYFSTQSSTLPAAMKTGNLTLRPWSIVTKILYDKDKKRATGVEILDAETNKTYVYNAKIIFLNASTLNSAWILMNSATDVWEGGLGSSSGELGHNIMDHHLGVGAGGRMEGYEDKYTFGRRANGIYIPRYQNIGSDKRDYLRGFGYQGSGNRGGWGSKVAEFTIGADFKEAISEPGGWSMGMMGFGEVLPDHKNFATLDKTVKDKWGLNVLKIDAELKENEMKMRKDMLADAIEMLTNAGVKDVKGYDANAVLGRGIHEMGTARMGADPKTSVVNKHNQIWDAPNVFVTDGSFMTSAACVNPSLTYMAFTARAADFAVSELKKGNL
ncbi:MAG: GMC family oxidoreductase [Sphingobacteriia bacterium 24-36-13]|jgi:choline dehydrogenase-like flavoprotein|uniref:GMC oxidoreductase n=1 Tax=Sediminibacterium sp. TaxID=1917865 RepID=UPI000BD45463|nr:GMC family oxidoreductase [Sediminibacterium sp.]OYY11742.1 MAG: GMC family oxidoreductase [Sphingobacteriia bacterium 35-36-14]OYZ53885.1 MAG: GMC family oxidoreductase [Sphingobacteriia bacterium 24-36-13]OZA64432.1 MAG: GMC family oxidoreductase [Sphingobacteriia bacterium 39-36-14]HQS23613.1 GMC family oxidoreductase [Sediminibacterium sp.]HQS34482.1 GMC family oxidoreductase [Sediminibacterium sp.]